MLTIAKQILILTLFTFSVEAQVISTIKPAGGGDYTTLAAWEAAADGSNDQQWAECYSGGDLGTVQFNSWSVDSSDEYPRVYVAEGEGHNGETNRGAFIIYNGSQAISVNGGDTTWLRVEGLRLESGAGDTTEAIFINNQNQITIDGNMIVVNHDKSRAQISINNGADNAIIRNNVIIDNGDFATYGIFSAIIDSGTTNIYDNNTVIGTTIAGIHCNVLDGTWIVRNCVSISNALDYQLQDGTPNVVVHSNNVSSDVTAGDFGTGGISNQIYTTVFRDGANGDLRLSWDSVARNAGVPIISSYRDDLDDLPSGRDIAGTKRPQGTRDVGAYERKTAKSIL